MVADRFLACAGVTAGMPLEEALSRNAGSVVLEADEPSYQRAFRRVLAALQGVGDRVESAGWVSPTFDWTVWSCCTAARMGWSTRCCARCPST